MSKGICSLARRAPRRSWRPRGLPPGLPDCFCAEVSLLLSPGPGKVPAVGFLDKARALLGIDKATAKTSESEPALSEARRGQRKKEGRPPLPEITASSSA